MRASESGSRSFTTRAGSAPRSRPHQPARSTRPAGVGRAAPCAASQSASVVTRRRAAREGHQRGPDRARGGERAGARAAPSPATGARPRRRAGQRQQPRRADAGRDRERQRREQAVAIGEAEVAEHRQVAQPAVDRRVLGKRGQQARAPHREQRGDAARAAGPAESASGASASASRLGTPSFMPRCQQRTREAARVGAARRRRSPAPARASRARGSSRAAARAPAAAAARPAPRRARRRARARRAGASGRRRVATARPARRSAA